MSKFDITSLKLSIAGAMALPPEVTKRFEDARKIMFDCGAFNFLEFENEINPSRKHGLFIGHKYRLEAKIESTFGDYIGNPKLKNVRMQISDIEKADKITDEILERAKKSSDRSTYLKEKMYYPKNVDDIFLNEDTNIFDVELAKRQKYKLIEGGFTGTPVVLYQDEDVFAFRDIKPASPVHILVVSWKHILSLAEMTEDETQIVGKMTRVANQLAREQGVAESGYRLTINSGPDAGQVIHHLHMHPMGGRRLQWGH